MSDTDTQARAIFFEALDCESPEDLRAYVDEACGDDDQLRARVDDLLRARRDAGGFLGGSAPAVGTLDRAITEHPGAEIDRYKLLEQIGEGGFGVVFMAEQTEPVRRKVALKIIKPGMDTKEVIARFEAERQALAMMDHPNIARVLDAAATVSGRPYFVMELVRGIPITEYCDQNKLTARERLELFATVCQAVQHAHQKGIIHRDIKPSNVMVTLRDDVPMPKVIDFGVAKATNARLTERTLFTRYAQLVGTPLYMSPEQAQMSDWDVDTRSDIYSLGVLLYELLTGTTPFDTARLREAAYEELLRIIREEEPPKPSTRISTLGKTADTMSARRKTDPKHLSQFLRGDIDWIVMKALEKDRRRRYETANGFAEDIQRYLNDEPVVARPPSAAYQFRKFARRNKTVLASVSLVAAALIFGIVGTAWQAFRAHSERDIANAERNRAEAQRVRAEESEQQGRHRLVRLTIANGMRHLDAGELMSSLPWFTEALRLDHADPARTRLHRIRIGSTLGQCPKLVWMWYHEGPVTFETRTLDLKLSTYAEFSPDGRYVVAPSGNMTARVWDATTGRLVHVLTHGLPVLHASFSRDGRRIATSSGDLAGGREGVAFVWDAGTGQRITPPLVHDDAVLRASFSPDGGRLVTGCLDKTARVWNVVTGEPTTPRMQHGSRVIAVSFSPDGRHVVTAGDWNTARIWDAGTGQPLTLSVEGNRHASFSPDGSRVVTSGSDVTRIWEASTGRLLTKLPQQSWHSSFSPDGEWVVTASADETAQVWEATTGRRVGTPLRHRSGVTQAQFSPNGRHVVTASWDRTARVWEASTGRPITLPLKHGGDVMCATFSPDGHRIVTASTDLLIRVWDLANLNATSRALRHPELTSASFSPDGNRVLTASADGTARVWDAATNEQITPPLKHSGAVRHAAFSPDGLRLLTASNDGTVLVWDAATGERTGAPLKHGNRPVVHASFSPDGDRIATASVDGTARVYELLTGETIASFRHGGPVIVAWFSPDGCRVLTGSADASAQIWDAATGNPMTPALKHKSAIRYASFSADGHLVLTTSNDGTAQVWDATTGKLTGSPLWHGQAIHHGTFSPDGRRVVTTSDDNTARVWDAITGKPLTPPLGWLPNNVVYSSFSRDGRLIATACHDGTARVWDADTGEPVTGALRHGNTFVVQAEFSRDGHRLLTACRDGPARLWDLLPDDRPVEDLILLSQVLCGHRIDATGGSLEPVEPRALRDAWQSLRDRYPDDFVASPENLFTWHREEAYECERLGRWSDAIEHLETARQYSTDTSNLSQYHDTLARLERLRAQSEEESK